MGMQFDVDEEAHCVRLTCHGRYSQKAMLRIFDEALEIAAKKGRKAALVDVSDLKGTPPSLLERFELGTTFTKIQQSKEKIIAMVVVGQEPIIDRQRFGEVVATNRGAIGKVFTAHDEAVAWLESKVK
jgi:hypothetical protein